MLDFQYHRTLNETASLAVENIRQAMILKEVNQKLEGLYIKDSLTGLYNRFGYNTFAGTMYKNNSGKVYIVFIDMDGLKIMNDTYGHDIGHSHADGFTNMGCTGLEAILQKADTKMYEQKQTKKNHRK